VKRLYAILCAIGAGLLAIFTLSAFRRKADVQEGVRNEKVDQAKRTAGEIATAEEVRATEAGKRIQDAVALAGELFKDRAIPPPEPTVPWLSPEAQETLAALHRERDGK
jgi:hypothetical protein